MYRKHKKKNKSKNKIAYYFGLKTSEFEEFTTDFIEARKKRKVTVNII